MIDPGKGFRTLKGHEEPVVGDRYIIPGEALERATAWVSEHAVDEPDPVEALEEELSGQIHDKEMAERFADKMSERYRNAHAALLDAQEEVKGLQAECRTEWQNNEELIARKNEIQGELHTIKTCPTVALGWAARGAALAVLDLAGVTWMALGRNKEVRRG